MSSRSSRKRKASSALSNDSATAAATIGPTMVSFASMSESASFESLNDDVLHQILLYTGMKSYVLFGILNKRCREVFLTKKIPKETFFYGCAPMPAIKERLVGEEYDYFSIIPKALSQAVVYYNRNDIFKWLLREKMIHPVVLSCALAAGLGRINLLKEMKNNVNQKDISSLDKNQITLHPTINGQLKTLKWLNSNGLFSNISAIDNAAEYGQIHILEWLKEIGLDDSYFSDFTSGNAAEGAQLETLEWLKKNDCPFTDYTFSRGAKSGQINIMEWLKDINCPWDSHCYSCAGEGNHLNILNWLEEKGCPQGDRVAYVLDYDDPEQLSADVRKWFHDHGFFLDWIL